MRLALKEFYNVNNTEESILMMEIIKGANYLEKCFLEQLKHRVGSVILIESK